jgi:hypothetical protein
MAELRSELKTEMGELRSELKTEMGGLRSELKSEMGELRVDLAGIRAEMVTRADLGELLRLHIDGRVGAISRWWLFATMTMQAATVGGIAAAIRL